MNNKPIKQIKNVQTKTLNFILSAIILACGINFIVTGIVDCVDNKRGWIYIIVGFVLVVLTIVILCLIEFLQSRSKIIIESIVTYDKENKQLIEVPGYFFSEELKKYLDAACSESNDIKSVWNKDYIGLNRIVNKGKGNTQVSLNLSSYLLNQLIEYILLKELSLITVDYFNKSQLKKRKVNKIKKIDVPDLMASNVFLNLFSKATSERVAFNNRENPNVVMAYASNGALFEMFELVLPQKCKINKNGNNIIELKHPLFKLRLTPAFTGFGAVLPQGFTKHYLHSNVHKVCCYKAMIGIELKLSWRAFFIKKSEYFEWIDKYIEYLVEHNSFQHFIDKIQWDVVKTIIECNSKEQN